MASRFRGGLLLFLPLLMACGTDTPPGATPEMGEPPASSTYRGILTAGLDQRAFVPCGEEVPAWVEDLTGGELVDLYGMLAGIPNEPVYAELEGVMGDPPASGAGARYPYGFQVTGIRQMSHSAESVECPEVEYGLVARGNEPGWAVRFAADGVELLGADLPEPVLFPPASERTSAGARVLTTTHADGRVLEVEVREEPCSDSMSGELFPFTALRRWQGSVDPGCAFGDG